MKDNKKHKSTFSVFLALSLLIFFYSLVVSAQHDPDIGKAIGALYVAIILLFMENEATHG